MENINTSIIMERKCRGFDEHFMEKLYKDFIVELEHTLNRFQSILKSYKSNNDAVLISELYRMFHTLKGQAALFDLESLEKICHDTEELIDIYGNKIETDTLENIKECLFDIFKNIKNKYLENGGISEYNPFFKGLQQGTEPGKIQSVNRFELLDDIFKKMELVVCDIAKKINKKVVFSTQASGIVISNKLVPKISDSLLHLLRNAVDHGIECDCRERKKNGKSSAGKIELISYLSGDNICIEVKDDGRGIDRDMLISKAIQKGILTSKDIKNKENILDIVFIKGLTTVKSITLVSGRGIGLDIVKENIDAVGGIVKVSSIKRKGTIFKIIFPDQGQN